MAITLSGWDRADDLTFTTNRNKNPNQLVIWKETATFGTGATDCYFNEVDFIPAGVDFQVMFVQNNTMSAAGDIVFNGAMENGGTQVLLKDDLIAYIAAADSTGQFTTALYDVSANGELPIYVPWIDADGAHSATTGTDKTATLYIMHPTHVAK